MNEFTDFIKSVTKKLDRLASLTKEDKLDDFSSGINHSKRFIVDYFVSTYPELVKTKKDWKYFEKILAEEKDHD